MKIKNRSSKLLKENIRWHTLLLLDQIEHNQQYSNVLIDQFVNQSAFDSRDNRLLVQLVYGVLQHRYTLNYYLEPYIKDKTLDAWIETLLRLSVYQLVYLDRIPSHAVVNEAVLIAKTNGHQGIANLVNGVLRNFLRQELRSFSELKDAHERLSIQYSLQAWIVDYFAEYLSEADLETFLKSLVQRPYISARIHPGKVNRQEVIQSLLDDGFEVEESLLSPFGVISQDGNLVESNAFRQGQLTIQDESSMLVAPLGNIQGHENVLDACAAPGGKASHIASLLNSGHLTALDISEKKLAKVKEHMERMDLSDRVSLFCTDALNFVPKTEELYDIIYLDAPCTGLGLMRRKPEIKYEKKAKDIVALTEIQEKLLNHLANFVKPSGYLIYSTCSLTFEENEMMIEDFLQEHPEFHIDPITNKDNIPNNLINKHGCVRIWPHQVDTDGFFIGRLIKKDKAK